MTTCNVKLRERKKITPFVFIQTRQITHSPLRLCTQRFGFLQTKSSGGTDELWQTFVRLTDATSLDKTGSCDYCLYLYSRQVENYRRQHNSRFLFFFCNNIFSSIPLKCVYRKWWSSTNENATVNESMSDC